jgi:hypothetical protein
MIEHQLQSARTRQPAWDGGRHARVQGRIEHTYQARKRRSRAASLVLSSFAGAAFFALAMRAFGGPADPGGAAEAKAPPPVTLAFDDGGFRADTAQRD